MRIFYAIFLFIFPYIGELHSQGIIINEFSQGESGSKEYIELLVVGPEKCSVVDIRSWIVDDNNRDFGIYGINTGYIKFTDDILWSRILSGTIITLWNVEDTSLAIRNNQLDILDADPNDFRIVIPVGCKNINSGNPICPSSKYVVGVTNIPTTANPSYNFPFAMIATTFRWASLIPFGNGDDVVQIRRPDGSFYFGLGYGRNNIHPEFSIYGSNSLLFSPVSNTYSLTNQFSSTPQDKRNWTQSTNRTPGSPNSGPNLDFINSIMVDDDCALNIKDEESEDPIYYDPVEENINETNYYDILGRIIKSDSDMIYNKVIIREIVYKNGDIKRSKILIIK